MAGNGNSGKYFDFKMKKKKMIAKMNRKNLKHVMGADRHVIRRPRHLFL